MRSGWMQFARPAVLVAEHDGALVALMRDGLEAAGYRVEEAADGPEALMRVAESEPDLAVLSWRLPIMSGLEVCRQLRRRRSTRELPIIMVASHADHHDSVRALDHGADDYMAKPFAVEALVARVRALLRRSGAASPKGALRCADVILDQDAHRVARGGRQIHLGPTEFRLLAFFMMHPDRVFAREQILNIVWGRETHVEERTVDVHIRRLRKAITVDGTKDPIRTVRSAGYALEAV